MNFRPIAQKTYAVIASITLCAISQPAASQPAQTDSERGGNSEWSVIVSPYLWAAALSGNSSIGPYNVPARVSFPTIVSNLDLALMGNVEVTNGRYGAYIDGQYTNVGKDVTVDGANVRFASTSSMLTLGGFFQAWSMEKPGNTVYGKSRTISLEPTFGLRWTQISAAVDPVVGKRNQNWVDPFIGVRVNADLSDRWNLFGEGDIGGFGIGSRFSANLQAYFGYRTFVFRKPTILRFGYRLWYQNYVNGSDGNDRFAWNVMQHGPVVGLSMVF